MVFIPEKISLLFIEDSDESAEKTLGLLEDNKHIKFDVTRVSTLKEGIDFLYESGCTVDVILLDLMLPNSQGVNTYLSIKESCGLIPVVIISKHEEIACECVKEGAQDFLIKPVHGSLLSRSLKYAIERYKIESVLRERENHYRTLVEAANASIYEIDFLNDRFTYVNDVMCKNLGYTREELMEVPPTSLLTESSIVRWAERWEALNRGEYIDKTFEYEGKRKDGETVWTLITADYQEGEDGTVVGARVVAIDITQQKKAKLKEQQILNELENRIHEWQEELAQDTILKKNKIESVSMDVQNLTNGIEVS